MVKAKGDLREVVKRVVRGGVAPRCYPAKLYMVKVELPEPQSKVVIFERYASTPESIRLV